MRACADIAEEQAMKAKIEVAALRDSVTTREEVTRDAEDVATIWVSEIERMRSEAVAQLVNLDEIGVRHRLDTITDSLLERIFQRMEKL